MSEGAIVGSIGYALLLLVALGLPLFFVVELWVNIRLLRFLKKALPLFEQIAQQR